jgi:hypothetical protein
MANRMQVTIDCHDPAGLVEFWALVLDYEPEPPPTGFETWTAYWRSVGVPEDELDPDGDNCDSIVDPAGVGPRVWFQIVPEGKTVKNRVHLDIGVGGGREEPYELRRERVDAKKQQLLAAGATTLYVNDQDYADHYGVTMRDPEGNEFCLH